MNQTAEYNEASVASHSCTICSLLNRIQNEEVSLYVKGFGAAAVHD